MNTPTQAAIEAARERLAKATEGIRCPEVARLYRKGELDIDIQTKALAIALQEMSDAAGKVDQMLHDEHWVAGIGARGALAPFILPDPVDPLVEVMGEVNNMSDARAAVELREALAKRGLHIVPVQS